MLLRGEVHTTLGAIAPRHLATKLKQLAILSHLHEDAAFDPEILQPINESASYR
jgi:hypothetical protein